MSNHDRARPEHSPEELVDALNGAFGRHAHTYSPWWRRRLAAVFRFP